MSKPKILVTHPFPGPALDKLKERYQVTIHPSGKKLDTKELIKLVKKERYDVIICNLNDIVDIEVLEAAGQQLKMIANYAVGYDNIDVKAAHKRDIVVVNTPEVLTQAVAEHTFALILALARRIVEADRFTRAHRYKQWESDLLLGTELYNKTLGIIGLGRIGQAVATIGRGFGMNVIYNDAKHDKQLTKKIGLSWHELDTVLKESDIVTLHVPLLPTTKHLINSHKLSLMKETAILINTARGPVIEEQSLVKAIEKKQIAGVGLDVFEYEPKINRQLTKMSNVVLTPHIASATLEARSQMGQMIVDNIVSFFANGKAITPIKF